MAGRVLGSYVHVTNKKGETEVLAPGQELPAWAKEQVTNPAAFRGDAVESESEPTGATESATGYAALAVKDLKAELKKRELPQTGKQAELIARLEKDDADKAAAPSTTEALSGETGDGSGDGSGDESDGTEEE
jgi:hypothetical protein